MSKNRVPALIDEQPIVVYPSIAQYLGINKAVMVQQLHFLLNMTKQSKDRYHFVDDKWWVYNSYTEWKNDHFPWLSEVQIKRLFIELEEEDGVIETRIKGTGGHKKWYTINYIAWRQFVLSLDKEMPEPPKTEQTDQNDTATVSKCSVSELPTESTTENKEKESAPEQIGAITEKKKPAKIKQLKPYDDIPHDQRIAVIHSWAAALPKPPVGAYGWDSNHDTAAKIIREGYTPLDVERYAKAAKAGYFKDKTLTLQKVAELMPEWLARNNAAPPQKQNSPAPQKSRPAPSARDGVIIFGDA